MQSDYILELNAANLGELDQGLFGRAIDRALQIVQDDILNRPCDAAGKCQTRKVVITLHLTPEVEIDPHTRSTNLRKILVEPEVKGSVPPVRGTMTDVRILRNRPHFNRDIPSNFSQTPLDFVEDDHS